MAVDGLSLTAAINEAREVLTGARIAKVLQPEKDELALIINSPAAKSVRLLISAAPENCRLHITSQKKENPNSAPMFCMLLRKHLIGGKILSVAQPHSDRVIIIEIESTDELYDTNKYYLIAEIMGRHSNIILTDDNYTILDSIRHVSPSMSSARLVMPNIMYEAPPTAQKADPALAKKEDFVLVLQGEGSIAKLLSGAFYGIAPSVISMLIETFSVDKSRAEELNAAEREIIADGLVDYYARLSSNAAVACIVSDDEGIPKQVLPFLPCLPKKYVTEYESMAEALDEFYRLRDIKEHVRRHALSLVHSLNLQIERREHRIMLYDSAIASESDYEKYRLYGELITANLYRIAPQSRFAVVENYYADPVAEVKIELDPALSPSRNAQRYFKKYQKAKSARDFALNNRESTLYELEYLRSQLVNIARAKTLSELAEIREELVETGYQKNERAKNGKKQKVLHSEPRRFVAEDGTTIIIGRNNKQNDYVTMRLAAPNDIWLHTKNIPGSHVIIVAEGRTIPHETIAFAARLAAYYSDASASENVPVDYTEKRYVKKPAGALPGRVIYTNQHTVFVTPLDLQNT